MFDTVLIFFCYVKQEVDKKVLNNFLSSSQVLHIIKLKRNYVKHFIDFIMTVISCR